MPGSDTIGPEQPPLRQRPAEHAIRQWGDDIVRALEDLGDASATRNPASVPGRGTTASSARRAQRARAATQHARESLRWNLRARAGRAVPRRDGAVLDSLEELTARTRATAR